jgi:hypothetical protein
MVEQLRLCRLMGWTYDEVRALPRSVYDILAASAAQQQDVA